jgi:hypothetical protein
MQICFAKRKRGILKKAMELSILTNCKIMMAIMDQVDMKMTIYKSFKSDSEFAHQGISVVEHFSDDDVSSHFSKLNVVQLSL